MAEATPNTVQRYQTAGGVIIHEQQMLLLLRPSRNEIRLPKGHIDPGETPIVAALRETTEESGYGDLCVLADLGSQVVEFDREGQHYIRTEFYFLLGLQSHNQSERPPQDRVQFHVMWLPVEQAVNFLTYEAEKRMARKAIEAYAR